MILTKRIQNLTLISALVTLGDEVRLKDQLITAISDGLAVEEIEETILQCYLFAGFPRAINAFIVLKGVLDENNVSNSPGSMINGGYENWQSWLKRGEVLCRKVYGDKYEGLIANISSLNPELSNWMLVEGYGKVLSRNMLELKTRELAVVAALTVIGTKRQLHSHMLGAFNAGASFEELEDVVNQLSRFLDTQKVGDALKLLKTLKDTQG